MENILKNLKVTSKPAEEQVQALCVEVERLDELVVKLEKDSSDKDEAIIELTKQLEKANDLIKEQDATIEATSSKPTVKVGNTVYQINLKKIKFRNEFYSPEDLKKKENAAVVKAIIDKGGQTLTPLK